ncbi:uncharacterized protein LOC143032680 [Oratosquilla oratoria]|uniref:uncharacterized protein LOC143032680 n=1 Tax=Oratosquilla oratoria TaxID=337810 RepID=UPI003F771D73
MSANLVLNLTKCEFIQAKVHYLGYVIGQGELAPPQAKVEAILRIPVLQTKKEIRSFVGTIAFYRMFIYNFSSLIAPLTDLLKQRSQVPVDRVLQHSFCSSEEPFVYSSSVAGPRLLETIFSVL